MTVEHEENLENDEVVLFIVLNLIQIFFLIHEFLFKYMNVVLYEF